MLVLSRKPQEAIMIGGNIKVKVLSVKRGVVKIAIEAPESVKVDREEVYKKANSLAPL